MPIDGKTLLEKFELHGEWWLPHEPSRRATGTFTFNNDDDHGLTLSLIGTSGDSGFFTTDDFNPEIILGITKEGEHCTLLFNAKDFTGVSSGGVFNPKFSSQFLLIGHHFSSTEEMRFSQATVNYANLEEWIGTLPFSERFIDHEGKFVGLNATFRSNEEFRAEVPFLNTEFSVFHGINNAGSEAYRTMVWNHVASLQIKPVEMRDFHWYLDVLFGCRDLFTLCIGEPAYVKRCFFQFNEGIERKNTERGKAVKLYFAESQVRVATKVSPRQIIVPLRDVRGHIDGIFQAFFSKRTNLSPVYELLLGTYYNPNPYIQFQFLNLMQALETFHRRTFESSQYISKADYRELRKLIKPRIEDAFERFRQTLISSPPSHVTNVAEYMDKLTDLQALVNGRIDMSNSVSLQTRVKEIIDALSEELRLLITGGKVEFVRNIVKTRDDLTHYLNAATEYVLRGAALYNATIGLRVLLTFLILKELDVGATLAEELILRNERFRHEQVNEVIYESSHPASSDNASAEEGVSESNHDTNTLATHPKHAKMNLAIALAGFGLGIFLLGYLSRTSSKG